MHQFLTNILETDCLKNDFTPPAVSADSNHQPILSHAKEDIALFVKQQFKTLLTEGKVNEILFQYIINCCYNIFCPTCH